MIYGYARVSTKGQAKDGNSLESQIELLKDNGAVEIYSDSFTGTKSDRPEFSKLLQKLESGDTLIVTKLDRFARSMSQGSELANELLNRGIMKQVILQYVKVDSGVLVLLLNIEVEASLIGNLTI